MKDILKYYRHFGFWKTVYFWSPVWIRVYTPIGKWAGYRD